MKKTWGSLLLFCTIWLLVGCQEKTLLIEQEKNEPTYMTQPTEDVLTVTEVDVEPQQTSKSAVVRLIDPRTLEIVQTINPKELGFESDFTFYQTQLKQMAKTLARGTENFIGYDQTMELDRVGENGQIIKGNVGIILKESELVTKIIEASKNGENVYLPLYELKSNYQFEEVTSLNDTVIASFTTYFQPSEEGRSKNIELSALALNNIIVGEGDYFSFNTMVGERSEARGYQPAYEIVNKKMVMGIGGGICQTSSTLFNAIDQVALRITERHHHSLSVGYVPVGRDATVSYGTLDFKFQNTSGVPFLIKTFYSSGVLTIEIRTAQQYKTMLENT